LLYAHIHWSILGAAGLIYNTDTSKPVAGYGTQNMVTVQSGFQTSNLSITGPKR
jgi:hypothetical protein